MNLCRIRWHELEWRMILMTNEEAINILKLSERFNNVVKRFERLAEKDERFNGTKDNKTMFKEGILSPIQKQNK